MYDILFCVFRAFPGIAVRVDGKNEIHLKILKIPTYVL